ncbi:MAG: amino acid adenylation domain-containing protein [Terriglobia bacterium]
MTIHELISHLQRLDVQTWLEGDRVRISAPKGVMTPQLRDEISSRKEEILLFLRSSSQTGPAPVGNISVISRDGELPLSFSQQRLWFLDQMEPGNSIYNIWGLLWIDGDLNLPVLEQALREILRRHEGLRMAFINDNGSPKGVLSDAESWGVETIDLSSRSVEEGKREATEIAVREGKRPFDLKKGPLFRALLMPLSQKLHGLFLCFHHIVSDALSFAVFKEELKILYGAFLKGQSSPFPEIPVQYADYAHWERERWSRGDFSSQLEYWKKQLSGKLPVLELPSDRLRPKIQTTRGARRSIMVPAQVTSTLRDLARQEKATLFMVLLAAFKVLLSRYTGQEDVIVGTPIAGRTRLEFERLIGLFINTLVLRTNLSGNPSFRETLRRVRETALQAYSNQEVPFDRLVEVLHPERSVSHSPLFQVMFSLQPFSMNSGTVIEDLTITPVLDLDTAISRFDLTIDILETQQEGLKVFFEYNTDLFEEDTIQQLQSHFVILLEAIAKNPDRLIENLPLMTEAEKEAILTQWNRTEVAYSRTGCVHQLIEAQSKGTPENIAIQFGNECWTFDLLEQRVNQLARYLVTLGVRPDVLVGICLERSPRMVQAALATLKAGGAYVPLDPAFPKERLALMLEDSQVSVLLTQNSLMTLLPDHQAQVVCIDLIEETLAGFSAETIEGGVSSENLAYVIYTSGSTGKPKGVEIRHRSLTNFLTSMMREPGIKEKDRLLSVTTLSFDIAGLELYLPLIAGARVVLASRIESTDPLKLSELVESSDATVMQATPATWKMLIDAGWSGKKDLKLLCGGEALSPELAEQLTARGASLWNMYGPTETTIWSTLCRVNPEEGVITIGRPIANTQVYILDQHLHPVPIGVIGELFIGGDGLANGYLRRPELTHERFIRHPFSQDPTVRLYRTGDLARYRRNGMIECLGRVDHQVKIRGFRIELGEIESALRQHPSVDQCVVVAHDDNYRDRRLVAYYVSAAGKESTVTDLRNWLKGILPDYMVPSAYVELLSLPLTPNGKIDRRSLPLPQEWHSSASQDYEPPETESEKLLATIWKDILTVERVGIYDNFFDLGGHSLLSMRVVSQVEKRTGYRLNPRELIFQTLEQVAALIDLQEPSEKKQETQLASQKGILKRFLSSFQFGEKRSRAKL